MKSKGVPFCETQNKKKSSRFLDIENLDLDLDFVKILDLDPSSELPAVHFSSCKNLRITFERKHNKETNRKKHVHSCRRFTKSKLLTAFSFGFARKECSFTVEHYQMQYHYISFSQNLELQQFALFEL